MMPRIPFVAASRMVRGLLRHRARSVAAPYIRNLHGA
jgi:hypothetical protein